MSSFDATRRSRQPSHRRHWRLFAPTGALLSVVAPIVMHVMRLEGPPAADTRRTFYVSPDGDDGHDGRSPERAWRSLARTEKVGLEPGDRLLLRGGARFEGTIRLGPGEAGDPAAPVVVGSYGTGRATIETSAGSGITVYNTAGVDIRNLNLAGDTRSYARASGVKLYTDLPGARKLDHVVIADLDVTGFQNGVEIGSGNGTSGFRNVAVRDSVLHGNRDAGLASYGRPLQAAKPSYAHEHVTVDNVVAHHNLGDPDDHLRNTGSGIVLGSVRGGVVEHSVAHDNGARCDSPYGPEGIWAYDSDHVVIQHNLSYGNRTAGHTDGGGFGLDINTSSSLMQYNFSYGNDGAGYLINGKPTNPTRDNVVRFNISHNDARKSQFYSGILLYGAVADTQLYHNTVLITANGAVRPAALRLGGAQAGVAIRNNIFAAMGTQLVRADAAYAPPEALLQGNNLSVAWQPWEVRWGATTYGAMSDWRSVTGQERRGSQDTGLDAEPLFAGAAALPARVGRAADFRLTAQSPLRRHAIDLRATFGVDPGPGDYFGRPITGAVGAVQSTGG
jgi:hypothetical protein